MSSTYNAICLSHDPAILINEIARHKIDLPISRDDLRGHEHCDIVIGRWSGGLCELACPGRDLPGPTGCRAHHRSTEWTPVEWLRLLVAATTPPNAIDPKLLFRLSIGGCWPLDRIHRLRDELGLPTTNPPTEG